MEPCDQAPYFHYLTIYSLNSTVMFNFFSYECTFITNDFTLDLSLSLLIFVFERMTFF